MTIRVANPDAEPKIYTPGMHDDGRGVVQYILEVTHGIHDHWKKSEEHPLRWGYTYHERFVDQLPFIFQRIKADWDEKKGQWANGMGRPSGRDYQFAIWRAGEDIILEQPDAPCFQLGQIRLLQDSKGDLKMNYQTHWRSRDLLKAWNENNVAQVELMKLMRNKISNMLDVPVELGSYIDHSSSLHLYGLYFDRDALEKRIEIMQNRSLEELSMDMETFLSSGIDGGSAEELKRLVAAQTDAADKGHGLNLSGRNLETLGYDLENFRYPSDWDAPWPARWGEKPDITKLARVI